MGIRGLYPFLGDGEVTSIAALSAKHFQRLGRPLRIAVDEAGWRFRNLTASQVAWIQQKEPRAHPIEKAIFYRVCRLLRLNVQLVFIFDGPHRPWKRGKPAGQVDSKLTELLRGLFEVFGIPRYEAPAEAEAECARLQKAGFVDAVWSDDGDTLMFGCTFLIRDLYEDRSGKSTKSDTHIRVYRANKIWDQCQLDSNAFVLFAMLSGGDYGTSGLKGCGPDSAFKAAQAGFGRSLCDPLVTDLAEWRKDLSDFFKAHRISIEVPLQFPRTKDLSNYKNPLVSSLSRIDWEIPVDQHRLRDFVARYFNIQTPKFIEHVVPTLLVRMLVQTLPHQRASNKCLDVQLVKQTKKQTTGTSVERKITYLPMEATTIIQMPLDGDDYSKIESKDGTPYDPCQRVECEVLECLLRAGLPEATFAGEIEPVVPKVAKKRRAKAGQSDALPGKPARKKSMLQTLGYPERPVPRPTEPVPLMSTDMPSSKFQYPNPVRTANERVSLNIFADSDDDDDGYDLLRRSCGRPSPSLARLPLEPLSNLQDVPDSVPNVDRGLSKHAFAPFPTTLSEARNENFAVLGVIGVDRKQQERERLERLQRKGEGSSTDPRLVSNSSTNRFAPTTLPSDIEVIDLT